MSDKNQARCTDVQVWFDGVNISKSLRPYLLSMTYTDNAEDEADDLQIQIHDREGVWLTKWLNTAIQEAAIPSIKGLRIRATITQLNWKGDGKSKSLDCGEFELDSVSAKGPPATITIKGTSLPFNAQIRQTKHNQAWESYSLSGIGREMAMRNGLQFMFESRINPVYERMEQTNTSDIEFLSKLCKNAGISLKVTDNTLVLFEQSVYEAKPSVLTIRKGDGSYTKWSFDTGEADRRYSSCRVSYTDPATGTVIEGYAYADDYDPKKKNNQCLEVFAKVTSADEAAFLAAKRLRLHNKYEKKAAFDLPGNLKLVAGVTVTLSGWGAWDGKYMVAQAVHSIGDSGHTTKIKMRHVLGGY